MAGSDKNKKFRKAVEKVFGTQHGEWSDFITCRAVWKETEIMRVVFCRILRRLRPRSDSVGILKLPLA